MKFECVKEKIEPIITRATRVTGRNVTLPVLQCVLIEAKENQLTIRATNLDIGVEFTVPVKVTEPGIVALPGDVLSRYLSQISDEQVRIESDENGVTVATATSTTTINTLPYEDFPTLPQVSEGTSLTIPAEDLTNGLRSVSYAAATSTMKPELASVYIAPSDDQSKIIFTATDSFRLAEKRVGVSKLPVFEYVLIPARNVIEVIRLLEESNDDVTLHFGEGQVAFDMPGVYITTRIIDGTFPDYKQIIPNTFQTEATILKRDLLNSLKIATIFADKFHQVTFDVSPNKKQLILTTRNSDVGKSSNQIDGALTGEQISITFNHKYVIDGFQSINADSVTLQFAGTGKPMVMRGVSDTGFTYLVMPMNK